MARQSPSGSRAARKGPLSEIAAHMHKGGLHESLGIPEGQKIPASDLAVKPGDSTRVKRQKRLAQTFAKYRP